MVGILLVILLAGLNQYLFSRIFKVSTNIKVDLGSVSSRDEILKKLKGSQSFFDKYRNKIALLISFVIFLIVYYFIHVDFYIPFTKFNIGSVGLYVLSNLFFTVVKMKFWKKGRESNK